MRVRRPLSSPAVTVAVAVAVTLAGCGGAATRHRDGQEQATPIAATVPLPSTDLDGEALDLERDLAANKLVAFVFWQTWCPPCAAKAPRVVEAFERHGQQVSFVGVVPGPDAEVDEAAVRDRRLAWGYRFPQVRDRSLELTEGLGVRATPALVVLGPDRRVLFQGHGLPEDWDVLLESARSSEGARQ